MIAHQSIWTLRRPMIFSTSRTLVLIGSVIVTLGSGTNYVRDFG